MGDVLPPGTRLGRYEIVQRLALGGMAEIYLARASGVAGFAKHVVLKRILPSYARDPEFVRMFFNEARYAATLDHPNIAHVYDLGEEHGLHYFTMEYLHGEDCRTLLRELQTRKQPLPLAHALTIVAAAANGCHFAHELADEDGRQLGLIHRDVSPSNVVVTYAGAVKLVDFGIAKATNFEDVTAIGVTKGKLAYMAPEQCRGEPLDRRVDVYALGVLLYELTTLRRAFHGANDAAVMWAVVTGSYQPPTAIVPDYPEALAAIVTRAMAAGREDRYATARELQQAIEGFARDAGLSLSPSALGDWLERTMGPKLEPWRTAEAVARRPANRAPTYEHLALEPTKLAAPEPTPSWATPSPVAVAPPPSRRGAWWMVAMVIVAGGVAAAVALVVRSLRTPAPPGGQVVLVTERGTAALEPGTAHAVDSGAAVDAGAVTDAAAATVDERSESMGGGGPTGFAGGAGGKAPRGIDAAVKPPKREPGDPLSLAFARHQGEVSACFRQHSTAVVGQPEIALRFVINSSGVPTDVSLLPTSVAETPLGACLLAIGRSARFPAQADSIAFRIPLSVRRQGGR